MHGTMSLKKRQDSLLYIKASKPFLGSTQPPVEGVPVALTVGAKRPVREADYSHPVSDENKKQWSCNSTNPWCGSTSSRGKRFQCCSYRARLQVGAALRTYSEAVFGHASVASTTVIREDNNTDQNPKLLEGVTHTSLYFTSSHPHQPPPPHKTELFMSYFPHMSEYM